VPALYFDLGVDDREGGVAAGEARAAAYIVNDYHKPSDEWRPGMDFRGSLENLELLYQIGAKIAGEKRYPNWYPTSEFRAARDRSLAAP
jgi:hypothetical protein